jgi:adenylate cyclase
MEKDPLSRKLAVILHADVVGSTSLVQKNEALAHQRIQAAFHQFSETINSYSGITRELRGDALVAEFERASDAVTAALAFQGLNEELNATLDDDIKPQLRIGISLGEVIIADNTLTGAGVVLAQRLEQLADTGGVVVQGSVSETVPTRMPFDFESLGEQMLKGFDQPVRAFAARLQSGKELPAPEVTATPHFADPKGLQVPDKPSIAVLPFTSMSNDSEQEFLADGITDDIITNLSRFRDLFVIASNSSFVYKGKAVNVQDVSRELGVRYILEGSIQKSKGEIRINAQLIEGSTGSHLWAERYQRHVEDIFELQDEVVGLIVGSLATGYGGRLRKAWQRRGSENPKAFDSFMRGMDLIDNFTPEDNRRAKEYFEESIRLNPNYGKAYSKLAWVYILDAVEGWDNDYENSMAKGLEAATRGLELEDEESWVHWVLGVCHFYALQHDLGIAEFERAIELNPNDADVLADAGYYFTYAGKAEEGAELIYQAMRINPHYPEYYLVQLGQVLFDAHKYEEAIATFAQLRNVETPVSCLYLAASQAAIGKTDKAKEAIDRVLKHDPEATIEKWTQPKMHPYNNPEDAEHFGQNLRKAGLPD